MIKVNLSNHIVCDPSDYIENIGNRPIFPDIFDIFKQYRDIISISDNFLIYRIDIGYFPGFDIGKTLSQHCPTCRTPIDSRIQIFLSYIIQSINLSDVIYSLVWDKCKT